MADALWTLSLCATVLAWLRYVPEFRRLWRERAASGAGYSLWAIWVASSTLSFVYALLCEAPFFVVLNCAVVAGLNAVLAILNCLFGRPMTPLPT